jgi:hypothetical protein
MTTPSQPPHPRAGRRGPVHPSTSFLFFTGLARRRQACRNGLLLWVTLPYHLTDVFGNGLFRRSFFEGHDYSPFILVVYFLPRQVNCLAPEVRAALNAWSKDFLLKEA